MKSEFSKVAFWAATAAGVVCVFMLAALTFQSLFRLFGTQPKAGPEEKAMPAMAENASPGQDAKSVSDTGQPSANPAPAAYNEFCTDSEAIRQHAREQQERKNSQPGLTDKNPDSKTGLPTEKLEQGEPALDI